MNEEIKNEEVEVEQDNEVVDVEQQVEESEEQNDRVPLNKFLEEKKKRKELERKMKEFESKEEDNKRKSALDDIRKLAKDKEFDDDTAELFAEVLKMSMSMNPKSDPILEQINEDITDIAELNPDVLKYKKEITATVKKFAKAGEEISVEEAYRFVAPNSLRHSEMQTDIEQKAALRRRESYESNKLNSSSKSITSKYQLDEADKKALVGLQKYQPNAGWNEEKYFKTMKG